MSKQDRRQFLEALLGTLAQAAGTVVVATSILPAARGSEDGPPEETSSAADLQARADRLAQAERSCGEGDEDHLETFPVSFLNRGFRNGGFVNGGFRNGGFRNGGFVNGGFRNGGFRNGSFRNF